MRKNYIVDTDTWLYAPECIEKLGENDIFVPHPIIEELSKYEEAGGSKAEFARKAMKKLQEYRGRGNLMEGVDTTCGGKLYLLSMKNLNYLDLPAGWEPARADNMILLVAKSFIREQAEKGKNTDTILVTKSANMQLKADIMGIPVESI